MQPVSEPRHDPAPSRWGYRLQRLWLTPLFRALMRVGLPSFLVIFALGAYFSQEENRLRVQQALADARESIEMRPEFTVQMMRVDGASPALADAVRSVLPLSFPVSSFDLDLETMRQTVASLPPVRSASLHIRPGGVLQVQVSERVPVAVWRRGQQLFLVDDEGAVTGAIFARGDRPELPLLAGQGAERAVEEALALVAAARPLKGRLRGLVRVGERRWDVVLDRDQRILLPMEDAVSAMERVVALAQARDLLERDVAVVDLRDASRPVVRLNPPAVEELRAIRSFRLGE